MRSLLLVTMFCLLIFSCSTSNYRLSEYEKGKLKGYHANEANRLIEANNKNRKVNRRAAEKYRQEQSARLNELNRSNQQEKSKKTGKSTKAPFMQ